MEAKIATGEFGDEDKERVVTLKEELDNKKQELVKNKEKKKKVKVLVDSDGSEMKRTVDRATVDVARLAVELKKQQEVVENQKNAFETAQMALKAKGETIETSKRQREGATPGAEEPSENAVKRTKKMLADEEKAIEKRIVACQSLQCHMHLLRDKLSTMSEEAAEIMENVQKQGKQCDWEDEEVAWMQEMAKYARTVSLEFNRMVEQNQSFWLEEDHKQILDSCEEGLKNPKDAEKEARDKKMEDAYAVQDEMHYQDGILEESRRFPKHDVPPEDNAEKNSEEYSPAAPHHQQEYDAALAEHGARIKNFATEDFNAAEDAAAKEAAASKGGSAARNVTTIVPRKKSKPGEEK